MPSFEIITAVGPKGLIGAEGKLPWNLPDELKHFKKLTRGYTVLMGRKTFESIGKPLPERLNIIVTSQRLKVDFPNVFCVRSVQEGYELAKLLEVSKLFVIGGAGVYAEALTLPYDCIHYSKILESAMPNGWEYLPDLVYFPKKVDLADQVPSLEHEHWNYYCLKSV